jgi:hypothetical protein
MVERRAEDDALQLLELAGPITEALATDRRGVGQRYHQSTTQWAR